MRQHAQFRVLRGVGAAPFSGPAPGCGTSRNSTPPLSSTAASRILSSSVLAAFCSRNTRAPLSSTTWSPGFGASVVVTAREGSVGFSWEIRTPAPSGAPSTPVMDLMTRVAFSVKVSTTTPRVVDQHGEPAPCPMPQRPNTTSPLSGRHPPGGRRPRHPTTFQVPTLNRWLVLERARRVRSLDATRHPPPATRHPPAATGRVARSPSKYRPSIGGWYLKEGSRQVRSRHRPRRPVTFPEYRPSIGGWYLKGLGG